MHEQGATVSAAAEGAEEYGGVAPRAPLLVERAALVRWLDGGLRGGRAGRLEAEYPLSMDPAKVGRHRVVYEAGRPRAHAMLHAVTLRARGCRLPLGLIGNVYTEPGARSRGLASACVEACIDEARRLELPIALLWSDREAFYRRLGFHECGLERYVAVDAAVVERAAAGAVPFEAKALTVREAAAHDFPMLERLYARKEVCVERAPGSLRRLARAPDTRIVCALSAGGPHAYAALGRGDDLAGVVHEWAGEPQGVLACLAELCGGDRRLLVLTGPGQSRLLERLRAGGAAEQCVPFARAKILDAERLWQRLGGTELELAKGCGQVRFAESGGGWSAALREADALRVLFGEPGAASTPAGSLKPADRAPLVLEAAGKGPLRGPARAELARLLPFPLHVWGFDSI